MELALKSIRGNRILIVAGITIAACILPIFADALTCDFPNEENAIARSEVIFVAELIDWEEPPGPTSTLRVHQIWKGMISSEVIMAHNEHYGHFDPGDTGAEFLVFNSGPSWRLDAGMCPVIISTDWAGKHLALLGPQSRMPTDRLRLTILVSLPVILMSASIWVARRLFRDWQ